MVDVLPNRRSSTLWSTRLHDLSLVRSNFRSFSAVQDLSACLMNRIALAGKMLVVSAVLG